MFEFVGRRITRGYARLMAWFLVTLYVILATIGLTLQVITGHPYAGINFPILISMVTVATIWPVTGALIISRHPRHPVGWLLILGLMGAAFDIFSAGYVLYDIHIYPGSLPGLSLPLIFLKWSGFPFFPTAIGLMILTFPTGRIPSPAWRKVAIATITAMLLHLILQTLEPGPAKPYSGIFLGNPLGVSEALWAKLEPLFWVASGLLVLCNLAAISSLFLRLRQAKGEERQQIKWLFFPAAYYCFTIPFLLIAIETGNNLLLNISLALSLPAIAIVVIAVAFAIFKYRLYDIDIIINRTLVYGTLTAVIVTLYVLIVGGAGLVIQTNANLAGVLITAIIVVILFRPLQIRLQGAVDRLVPVKPISVIASTSTIEIHPDQTFSSKKEDLREVVREKPVEAYVIQLPERIRPFLRILWFFWAILFLIIIILNVPAQIKIIAETMPGNWPTVALNIAIMLAQSAGSLTSLTLAGVLYFKRPKEGMALFLSYFLLVIGIVSTPTYFLEPIWSGTDLYVRGVIQPLILGPFLITFLSTFPNGRPVPAWTRWLIIAAIIYAPIGPYIFTVEAYSEPTLIYILSVLVWFALIFTGIYAQVYRYRHVSNPEERQQTKWFVYAFVIACIFVFFSTIWTIVSHSQSLGTLEYWWSSLISFGWILAYATLPISLTIAVMRYRLYDIDIIINRTLVYGVLTAVIVILYVLIVGGAGMVIQTNANLAGVLITAVLVIIIFRPLRIICQQGVDRLLPESAGLSLAGSADEQPQQTPLIPDPTLAVPSSPKWLKLAHWVWYPTAVFVFGIFFAAIPGFFILASEGTIDPRFSASPSVLITIILRVTIVVALLTSLTSLLLAVLLFRRRADDHMAVLTSFLLLVYGIIMSGPLEALEPFIPGIAIFTTSILIPLFQPFILLLFVVFPDGRFVPPWTKWVIISLFFIIPASLVWTTQFLQSFLDFSEQDIAIILGVNTILFITILCVILYAQVYRYHRVSTLLQKQQTKWVLYGISLWFTIQFLSGIPWVYTYSLPPGTPYPLWLVIAAPFWYLSIISFPLTLTIAVMRYRLFDIDFLINRSLMYGALTLVVITVYVIVVGALGLFFQAQGNLIIALLATGIVAVLFQPLREKLQRGVNRLIYGERDDPIEALSQLGRSLETALPADQVLITLVETIAQTLKLPFVGLTLRHHESDRPAAQYGEPVSEPLEFSLTFQGKTTGHLLVAPRSGEEGFTPAEMRLLRNLARQASAAVWNAQLTADLQHSRQQLVTTREEERLRLRRDLHDGLGAALASVVWQADSARNLVYTDPAEAVELLESSIEQAQTALDDIRRLVYGLRPPALDELGLVEALQQSVQRYHQTAVVIKAPDPLPALPAAVEVAAYRIIQEALKNAMEHGLAKNCVISLLANGFLEITIRDDGEGLPEVIAPGIGLISMRERAEELGGSFSIYPSSPRGTELAVRLPLDLGG